MDEQIVNQLDLILPEYDGEVDEFSFYFLITGWSLGPVSAYPPALFENWF